MHTQLDSNIHIHQSSGDPLVDLVQHRVLTGKLIYLIVTRLDTFFVIDVLSRYMQNHYQIHSTATSHVLRYLKGFPDTNCIIDLSLIPIK